MGKNDKKDLFNINQSRISQQYIIFGKIVSKEALLKVVTKCSQKLIKNDLIILQISEPELMLNYLELTNSFKF